MKKILLNTTLLIAFGSVSFAQNATQFTVDKAKSSKNLLNPSPNFGQPALQTRAEGDIIWSNDFSNAADWTFPSTSTPPHTWVITTNLSAPPMATQTASLIPVGFASGSNGYAMCNSDAAGDGSTTNATLQWNGTPIDCSNNPNVSLRFSTCTRNWSSQYFVRVSGDNGANWTEFPVLQHITTNVNTSNPEEVTLNISSVAGGASEVLIAFRYEASWGWFWAVDDVELFETWNYDLVMNNTLNSVGEAGLKYSIYPTGQVTAGLKMGFGAQGRNNGALSLMPQLQAVQGAWTGTGAAVTVAPLQTEDDSLSILAADGYEIPSTAGTYDIELSLITTETVQDPSAVMSTMPFEVSPLIMAGDDFDGTAASLDGGFFGWATATGDPGIGREFELNNAAEIHRIAVGIANVAAANQATYVGNELFVELWKIVDGQFEFVSITQPITLQASNFANLVYCYFEEPVATDANTVYAAFAVCGENNLVPVAFSGVQEAGTTIGKAGAEFITLASDGEYVEVPVIRLDFGNYVGINENTILEADVNVYPNPAQENAKFSYTLNESAEVVITVTDLSGKVVMTINPGVQATGNYNTVLDLMSVAPGMYNITLNANGSSITKKLMKN